MTPIELALERWFRVLGGDEPRIVCLRGGRWAPRFRQVSDVDVACTSRSLSLVERELRRSLRAHGVAIVSRHRGASLVQYHLYSYCGAGHHHHLGVDLHTNETCFGIPFMSARDLLADVDTSRRVPRPAVAPGALVDVLTPYLSACALREEYVARLEVVAEKHPVATRAWLGRFVGTRMADKFLATLRVGHRGELARLARPFRRALVRRAFARRPITSALGFVQCFVANRIAPLFRPRGVTVALLGTDGTGKSTLAEALHEELATAFRSPYNRTIKLRPGLLPQIGRFFGRKPSQQEYEDPHRAEPSGTLGTWLRATYYFIDYTLGYALRVHPLRRRNSLVLFDRWIDDWLVDPARYRMRAGSRYVSLLARLAPRPDVVLVTTASHRDVRQRKQELTTRESLRQLEAYERYASTTPHAFEVHTSRSLQTAVDAAVLAVLARRTMIVPQTRTRSARRVA